jgi:hypothetical protein
MKRANVFRSLMLFTFLFAIAFWFVMVNSAKAEVMISQFGDKDGFGIGVQDNQDFDYTAVGRNYALCILTGWAGILHVKEALKMTRKLKNP